MSFTTTKRITPPSIKQYFSPLLLLSRLQIEYNRFVLLQEKAKKKIRPQDIGKKRDWDLLLTQYQQIYNEKSKEEAEFNSKKKEELKKRPYLPNTGVIATFERFEAL